MDHDKNILLINNPILRKLTGLILAVIAIVSAIEWNQKTGTYWGFLLLAIAIPGIFHPLLQIFHKIFK
jgi:hypothetical protein